MLRDQCLELRHELRPAPERELRVGEVLDGSCPQLFEPRALRARERLELEPCQRRPTPQRERLLERALAFRGGRVSALREEALEAREVELLGSRLERVAARLRDNRAWPQGRAELRDVVLESRAGGSRRILSPEALYERVARDDLAPPQEQQREQRPLLLTPELDWLPLFPHLERAEHSKLQHRRRSSTVPGAVKGGSR